MRYGEIGFEEQKPLRLKETLRNAKELVEKKFHLLFRSSTEKIAEECLDGLTGIITQKMKQRDPDRKINNEREELRYIIAKTNLEAAQRSAEGMKFPDEDFNTVQEYIESRRKNPLKGEYDPNTKTVIINLEEIGRHHKEKEEFEACVALTVIHEGLHHFGGFEKEVGREGSRKHSPKFLDEAQTEFLAREYLGIIDEQRRESNPECLEYSKHIECDTYGDLLEIRSRIAKGIEGDGNASLERYYFSRDRDGARSVTQALTDSRISVDKIERIFELGETIADESVSETKRTKAYQELMKQFNEIELRKAREEMREEMKRKGDGAGGISPALVHQVSGFLDKAEEIRNGEARRETQESANINYAVRLVSGAALYFKLQEGRDAEAVEIFERVTETYMEAGQIYAQALWDTYAQATKGVDEISFVEIVRENFPDNIETRAEEIKDPQIQKLVELLSPSKLEMKFGEDLSGEGLRVVESAVNQYALMHEGRLPEAADIQAIVTDAVRAGYSNEGIIPNAEMALKEIVSKTLEVVQDRTLPESERELLEIAREVVAGSAELAAILDLKGAEAKTAVADVLSRTEYADYAPTVAGHCEAFLLNLGIEPTFGAMIAVISEIGAVVANLDNQTLCGPILEMPGANSITTGTIEIMREASGNITAELREERLVAKTQTETEAQLYAYWSQKSTGVSVNVDLGAVARPIQDLGGAIANAGIPIIEATIKGIGEVVEATVTAINEADRQIDAKYDQAVVAGMALMAIATNAQPLDLAVASAGSLVTMYAGNGAVTTPERIRYAESQGVVGATQIRTIRGGSRKFVVEKTLLEELRGSDREEKPTKEMRELPYGEREVAQKIAQTYESDLDRLAACFELTKREGGMGIKASMYLEDREGGSKTVSEVIYTKQANCLESTLLFIAMAREAFSDKTDKPEIFAVDVAAAHSRSSIGHAVVGVLTKDPTVVGWEKFNTDIEERRQVLTKLGRRDEPGLKMLIIDPINETFDGNFASVYPLDDNQITSYFHFNSAADAVEKGDIRTAKAKNDESLKCWNGNPSANRLKIGLEGTQWQRTGEIIKEIPEFYKGKKIRIVKDLVRERNWNDRTGIRLVAEVLRQNVTDFDSLLQFLLGKIDIEDYEGIETIADRIITVGIEKFNESALNRTRAVVENKDRRIQEQKFEKEQKLFEELLILIAKIKVRQGKISEAQMRLEQAKRINNGKEEEELQNDILVCRALARETVGLETQELWKRVCPRSDGIGKLHREYKEKYEEKTTEHKEMEPGKDLVEYLAIRIHKENQDREETVSKAVEAGEQLINEVLRENEKIDLTQRRAGNNKSKILKEIGRIEELMRRRVRAIKRAEEKLDSETDRKYARGLINEVSKKDIEIYTAQRLTGWRIKNLRKGIEEAVKLVGEQKFNAEVKRDCDEILGEFPKTSDHFKYLKAGREHEMWREENRVKIRERRQKRAELICIENNIEPNEENIKRIEKKEEEMDNWSWLPWLEERDYNIRAFKIK